jgi:hypothetical protein
MFISEGKSFHKFKIGLGEGSNNYVELLALKYLLKMAAEKEFKPFRYLGILKWF